MSEVLLYIGSALAILWGAAHLFATKPVVRDFGDISGDNRLIITQEWIAEGIATCFIGLLVLLVTALEGASNPVSLIVYRASAGLFVVIAGLTVLTGARTPGIPFKICPFLLSVVAALFLLGSFV